MWFDLYKHRAYALISKTQVADSKANCTNEAGPVGSEKSLKIERSEVWCVCILDFESDLKNNNNNNACSFEGKNSLIGLHLWESPCVSDPGLDFCLHVEVSVKGSVLGCGLNARGWRDIGGPKTRRDRARSIQGLCPDGGSAGPARPSTESQQEGPG